MDADWQRAFTRILARLILACGLTALASAQTPGPKQEPATQPNLAAPAQPVTPSQATPSHLAGVEADKVVRWTLKDAILAALEKNPDIEIARHNVRLSQFDVLAAQGVYDEACLLRFRPIMMTTMAALLVGLPLALGAGVGSKLRRALGVTIVGGLLLSQLLTLYTTPAIYLAFDRVAQRLKRARGSDSRQGKALAVE